MNDTINYSWSKRVLGHSRLLLIVWLGLAYLPPAYAQQPPGVVQAIGEYPDGYDPRGGIQQVQLPQQRQYYEYLPPQRGWDDYRESSLDRLLKQTAQQTYGKFEYLNWAISDPSHSIIGAPGKRLNEGLGFSEPAYIDAFRASQLVGFDALYPIRNPNLYPVPGNKVLIQVWETNEFELSEAIGGDDPQMGTIGVNDYKNDVDVFPRLTNEQKINFFTGVDDANLLVPSTGTPTDPAQVAVLTVGQLANSQELQLDNNNGFRGVVGVNTTFGALETSFFSLDRAKSGLEFVPLPNFLLGTPGAVVAAGLADPMVIPVLVNGQMAPDVFDSAGNLVTDSNNYFLIFNDSYKLMYESEAWGFSPNVLWTFRERPDRYKISTMLGFQYFDFREQMRQQGRFTQTPTDPFNPFYVYDNELQDNNAGTDDSLTSTIDSVTENRVMGPTVGIRTEVGDERLSFGLDTKLMLGVNSYEAEVGVDDLLFVGDDNFTSIGTTDFTAGFDMVLDAKIKLVDHVTMTVGYNFMWFSAITRPKDNINYNVIATPTGTVVPAGTVNPGPDFTYQNDVTVIKETTTLSLSGLSVGVLIDW